MVPAPALSAMTIPTTQTAPVPQMNLTGKPGRQGLNFASPLRPILFVGPGPHPTDFGLDVPRDRQRLIQLVQALTA